MSHAALTSEQQAFVVRCWEYTGGTRGKFERYWPGLDYDGAAALRLCRDAPRFDPSQSHWKTWATNTVRYACRELMRDETPKAYRRKFQRQNGCIPCVSKLSAHVPDPAALDDAETDLSMEAVHDRLQGLWPRERRVILETIVGGRSAADLAREWGLTTSRVWQIRHRVLMQLREREGLVRC